MKEGVSGKAIYRKDYTAYAWKVEYLDLHFDIGVEITTVRAEMEFTLKEGKGSTQDIVLNGSDLEMVSISLNDRALGANDYVIEGESLTISGAPRRSVLKTEVKIHPASNSALEGLYLSGEFLLTQCEPQGFRKITWFPDRPDVMTTYSVTLAADKSGFPVLLSNGNRVDAGDLDGGRHWVRWEDPFPKPSYLFALVAGDLALVEDRFTTRSGREVALRIYVEEENIDRCGHAMESLINAMRWDEDRFDLEYDLDIYHIVATNDFNMGAMENKSLNIFNSKYVLARPDTATDADYQGIEGVIGHEYFHNWTGNRVTCQDWFQLTLKEGLTVFRDEEFSADMQSRAVKRIRVVRDLRSRQFPEDDGPMSHPIRPDRYKEINNFYTATVYQKGATIIRMYHTLLGESGFQKGMKLYFERHDGHAVTCDNFLAAMADANGVDLERFSHWYSQSGTPQVHVSDHYDAESRAYTLKLKQHTPATHDQKHKQPLVLPFALGLLNAAGEELALQLENESEALPGTRLLNVEEAEQEFTFVNIPEHPVPSLFRDYSAPVKVFFDYTPEQLAVLIAHDSDAFVRWDAAQRMAENAILEQRALHAQGSDMKLDPDLLKAFRGILSDRRADPALLAEALVLPDEDYLADQMKEVDVDGIHAARKFVKQGLADNLLSLFAERYAELNDGQPYEKAAAAMGRRSLKNMCLSYLLETPVGENLAADQLKSSDNMTDTLAAIRGLIFADSQLAPAALSEFESSWKEDALVMDKWFAMQAMKPGGKTLNVVRDLMEHPVFSIQNPNKVRALIGVFAMLNPTGFHAIDGSGYHFHADRVIELDGLNPQIAARMASAFNRWKRYDAVRRNLMKTELRRIAAVDNLSGDVSEIVSNALRQVEAEAV
ncbi:MAG: aminopeptidase N [Gammaproteobacteria bacterium]|nr:aminopeptidase N [Gammaproteobacteria bacterium]